MKTAVTELPESRVRLDVAIEPDAVAQRVDRAAIGELAGEMKMPGFRKGKVPPQLVIQRIGREAVLEQAMRDTLPEWYERALVESGLPTVGDPKLDVDQLPAEGEELESLDRDRRATDGRAWRIPGPGRHGPRPTFPTRPIAEPSSTACARALRVSRPSIAPRPPATRS